MTIPNNNIARAIRELLNSKQNLAEDSTPVLSLPFPGIFLKKEALKVKSTTLAAISRVGHSMVEQYDVLTRPARRFYEEDSKIFHLIEFLNKLGHDECNEADFWNNHGPQFSREIALCNAFIVRAQHSEVPMALTEICNVLDGLADRDLIHCALSSIFIMPFKDSSLVGVYVHVKSKDQETVDKDFGEYKVTENAEPRLLGEVLDLRKNKS